MAALDPHLAAQVLVSTWAISAPGSALPTSEGILDKALKLSIEEGAFKNISSQLNFVNGRTGLKCVELSSILNWAQAAELTQDPNPTYRETCIKISEGAAKRTLRRLGVKLEDAMQWGKLLEDKIELAKSDLQKHLSNA